MSLFLFYKFICIISFFFSFTVSFYYFNLVFYWRIISLQNFAVFWQISTWISHRYTYNLFILNLHPISLDRILKRRDITLPTKVHLVKAMVFPVVTYGYESWMDYKESWVSKNWCFWTVVLDKTLDSPLDSKKTQPVYPKGNQFWIFIRRTDAEAQTPTLWSPDAKNWLIWKHPDAGKDWRWD